MAAELFGGLGLMAGLLTRVAAGAIALIMLGAIATVHYRHGLFIDWHGNREGHGVEYHLLALALALVVVVKGAGPFSLDHDWYRQQMAQLGNVTETICNFSLLTR